MALKARKIDMRSGGALYVVGNELTMSISKEDFEMLLAEKPDGNEDDSFYIVSPVIAKELSRKILSYHEGLTKELIETKIQSLRDQLIAVEELESLAGI